MLKYISIILFFIILISNGCKKTSSPVTNKNCRLLSYTADTIDVKFQYENDKLIKVEAYSNKTAGMLLDYYTFQYQSPTEIVKTDYDAAGNIYAVYKNDLNADNSVSKCTSISYQDIRNVYDTILYTYDSNGYLITMDSKEYYQYLNPTQNYSSTFSNSYTYPNSGTCITTSSANGSSPKYSTTEFYTNLYAQTNSTLYTPYNYGKSSFFFLKSLNHESFTYKFDSMGNMIQQIIMENNTNTPFVTTFTYNCQ